MEYQRVEEVLFYAKTITLVVRQHYILCGDGFWCGGPSVPAVRPLDQAVGSHLKSSGTVQPLTAGCSSPSSSKRQARPHLSHVWKNHINMT